MNGNAWDGLGGFAVATGIYVTSDGSRGAAAAAERDEASGIPAAAVRSMVGYDRWEDDPARAAAAATVKALSALSGTTGTGGAPKAGSGGADARPTFPEARELIQRFHRRFGAVDAHTSSAPPPRFRYHHVGSLPDRRSVDEGRPPPGTIGDAQSRADQ